MASPDLGIKRVCISCAARFYDLNKRPIACPKCGATFEPEEILKSRRARVADKEKARVAPVAAEEELETEELEEAEDEAEDEEEEAEVEEIDAELDADAAEDSDEEEQAAPKAKPAKARRPVTADADEPTEDDVVEDEEELSEIEDDEEADDDLIEELDDEDEDLEEIIDTDLEEDKDR